MDPYMISCSIKNILRVVFIGEYKNCTLVQHLYNFCETMISLLFIWRFKSYVFNKLLKRHVLCRVQIIRPTLFCPHWWRLDYQLGGKKEQLLWRSGPSGAPWGHILIVCQVVCCNLNNCRALKQIFHYYLPCLPHLSRDSVSQFAWCILLNNIM